MSGRIDCRAQAILDAQYPMQSLLGAQDRYGFDQRGRIMLTIENGYWKLLK